MAEDASEKPKKSGRSVLIAVLAAVLLGAGSFYAIQSGLVLGSGDGAHGKPAEIAEDAPPVAFVAIEPLLVSLGRSNPPQNLRFSAHLEVDPADAEAVAQLMPRIMDVLNSYLRAVEIGDIRDPAALIRLRAQMLRRIQTVTGEGRVRDLLVSQFLVS